MPDVSSFVSAGLGRLVEPTTFRPPGEWPSASEGVPGAPWYYRGRTPAAVGFRGRSFHSTGHERPGFLLTESATKGDYV